jgi:hypothetical protein
MADEPKESAIPQTGEGARKAKESVPHSKASKFWEWVGKLAALVVVIGGLFGFFKWLFPSGPSLTAYCTSVSIGGYLTYGYDDAIAKLKKIEQEKEAKEKQGKKGHEKDPANSTPEPASWWSTFVQADFKHRWSSLAPTYAITCRIANDGSEPANDVTLHLPSRPVRFLINDKEEKLPESNSVNLNSVPVGPTTNVEVWLDGFIPPTLDKNPFFINYRGGKGTVLVGKPSFGLWHTAKENWQWIAMYTLMLAAFLLLIVQPFLGERRN